MVVLGDIGHYTEPIWHLIVHHVLRVKQAGDAELPLRQGEGESVVIEDVGRVKAVVVQKLWPEVVDDGAEGETRPEGAGHVLYPHIVVASHHSSDPNLTNAYN